MSFQRKGRCLPLICKLVLEGWLSEIIKKYNYSNFYDICKKEWFLLNWYIMLFIFIDCNFASSSPSTSFKPYTYSSIKKSISKLKEVVLIKVQKGSKMILDRILKFMQWALNFGKALYVLSFQRKGRCLPLICKLVLEG